MESQYSQIPKVETLVKKLMLRLMQLPILKMIESSMKILSWSTEKQNKLTKPEKLNQTNLYFQKKIPSNFYIKKFLFQMVSIQ